MCINTNTDARSFFIDVDSFTNSKFTESIQVLSEVVQFYRKISEQF